MIIDFGRYPVGREITMVNRSAPAPPLTSCGSASPPRPGRHPHPATAVPGPTAGPGPASSTRTFRFRHADNAGWTSNGNTFSPGRTDATPRTGTTEVWRLLSDFHHPIHLHLSHFQVITQGLAGPGRYDHGWKDVIDLRPTEEAAIIVRFDDYPGRYVFHCHNLEHEDMAMMGNIVTT